MRFALLLLLLLLAAACTGAPERAQEAQPVSHADRRPPPTAAERERPFVPVEYEPYRADGTGSISGQAFLKTRSGDVKFGAGNVVHVEPVTSYSEEWFQREIVGGEALEAPDPRAAHYHWTTRADGFGGFLFDGLPAGRYYVACRIVWEIPLADGGFRPAGGWAWAVATVKDGQETRAVVTR